MKVLKTEMRWTVEEARKLHVQLLERIEEANAEIAPKVERLMAVGRNEEAAKLLDDHRWTMQPLIDQAARLVDSFAVPFTILSADDAADPVRPA